jgi:hypothetical protein
MGNHKDPRKQGTDFFTSDHAITMIEQISEVKPRSTDHLGGKLKVRFHESNKDHKSISMYNILAAMHDYVFRDNRLGVYAVSKL